MTISKSEFFLLLVIFLTSPVHSSDLSEGTILAEESVKRKNGDISYTDQKKIIYSPRYFSKLTGEFEILDRTSESPVQEGDPSSLWTNEVEGAIYSIDPAYKILWTSGIGDCVGITIYTPTVSGLYHWYKSVDEDTFLEQFILPLQKHGISPSEATVTLSSSGWTDGEFDRVIQFLKNAGYTISKVNFNNIIRKKSERHTIEYYVNQSTTSHSITSISNISTAMSLNTETGDVNIWTITM